MIRRFINLLKTKLGFSMPVPITSPLVVNSTTIQTAPINIVRDQMTNELLFHNHTYKPLLTVNALVHGGTLKQRDFMRNALNVLRHIVVSELFQDMVLVPKNPFFDTQDNPLEIYKKFISGKDLYDQFEDNEMDVDVTLYYNKWTKTLGYTYPNTRKSYINMAKVANFEYEMMAQVIGNIVHEYMHNLGYSHTVYWTKDRENSVPYAYGYMARDLALEFLGSGRDIPKFTEVYKNVELN